MSDRGRKKRIERARIAAELLVACGYPKEAEDVVSLCHAHATQGAAASNLYRDNIELRERMARSEVG